MTKINNIAVMAISIGLFAGLGGFLGTSGLMVDDGLDTQATYGGMMGHVEATVRDANGQITSYSQGDNIILDVGEQCVAKMTFKGSGNTESGDDAICTGTLTNGFNIIGLVNATGCTGPDATSQFPSVNCVGIPLTNGLINSTSPFQTVAADSIVITTGSNGFLTTLTKLFTNTDGTANTIERSVILNSTSIVAGEYIILASQDFTSPATVSAGGTLTIVWEVTTGGTTTLGGGG